MGETTRVEGGVRAERGGVAAGRDVVARLVVTGDRNTFFVGGYQRLEEAYIDPWSVFERVRLERFVGRAWLEEEVDRFLRENDRGYLVLEANAGLGKSTFLAHLARQRGWVSHFVELAPGEAGVVPARKNLAAQVMRAFELAGEGEEAGLPDEAASRSDFLPELLRKAAEKRRDSEKIVVVVDGLDEAGTRPGENVLGLPRVLPDGVFFIVSKRPVPIALTVERPRRVITLDAESSSNLDDARAYLTAATSWKGVACALRESTSPLGGRYSGDDFVEAMLVRSGGVWVYLHFVLAEIEENHRLSAAPHRPLDLDALPQGLWAYYAYFWHRWKDEHSEEWHRIHRPLLAALAATREELSLARLCSFAGIEEIPELPVRWRPFLAVQRRNERTYRLYHESLQGFLHGHADPGELLEDEEDFADELRQATTEAHAQIANRYLSAWEEVIDEPAGSRETRLRDLDDGYGSRHLTTHLRLAGRLDDLFELVDDEAWETGRLTLDPSGVALMLDQRAAWRAAEEVDAESIARDRMAPLLGREVASACATARLRSLAEKVTATLLGALVETGSWTPALALGVIGNQSSAWRRAESLQALARAVERLGAPTNAGTTRTALTTVDAIENEQARCAALVAILPILNDAQIADAFITAKSFNDHSIRVDALAATAERLPNHLLDDALTAANEIDYRSGALYAIVALARRIDPARRQILLTETIARVAELRHGDDRVWSRLPELNPSFTGSWYALLAELPQVEQDRLFQESLEFIRQLESDVNRLHALSTLARYAPAHLMSDLLEIYEACHPPDGWSTQGEALIIMAPRVPEPLISRALEDAQRITDPYGRVQAIAALAPRLSPEQRDKAVDDAFGRMLRIPLERHEVHGFWREARSLALISLAPELPPRLLEEALDTARKVAFSDGRADALAALALRLAPPDRDAVLREAFRLVRRPTSDPAVRSGAVYGLTLQLPDDEQPPLIRGLVPTVERIGDLGTFVDALSALARRLDDDALLHTAIDAAREETSPEWRALALTSVALRSKEEARAALLEEALAAASAIDDPLDPLKRGRTYVMVAARLSGRERGSVARQALQIARAALGEHDLSLTEVLVRLAPLLPCDTLPDLIELARRLERPEYRATVLASLAPLLPGEQQPSIVTEALENVRQLEDTLRATLSSDDSLLLWDNDLLRAIAPWLPDVELRRYIDQAITDADQDRSSVVGDTLSALASAVPGDVLPHALKAATTIRDEESRHRALAAFAPRLRGQLAAEAFLAASNIVDDHARTTILRMLAQSVTELELRDIYPLWQRMLEVCATRGSEAVIAAIGALAVIVSRLGGELGVRATIAAIHEPA